MATKKDSKLTNAGVSGYNIPKGTPNHATKSHVVVAKVGDKTKTIRFGQAGVRGAGKNPTSPAEKARKKAKHIFAINAKYIANQEAGARTRLATSGMGPRRTRHGS